MVRTFKTGATRNSDDHKIQYARHFSPAVLKSRGQYMHKHRFLEDGTVREPDNWKAGFELQSCIDGLLRHTMDAWLIWETGQSVRPENNEDVDIEEALNGVMFNCEVLLHQLLTHPYTELEPLKSKVRTRHGK